MSPRYQAVSLYDSDQAPQRWHLVRKVVLLFLLVLALSLGLVILFRVRTTFPPILFNIFADASLGLIAGLGTRWVLRRPPWPIKAIVSAAASIGGLAVLGSLTNWKSGIGPIQIGLVSVNWLDWAHLALQLPLQFGKSEMDLLDVAHLAIAVDTSWIVLRAWARGPRSVGQPRAVTARQASYSPAAIVHQPAVSSVSRGARVRVPLRGSVGASAGGSLGARIKRRGLSIPMVTRGAVVRPARTGSRRWNPRRHKPTVQLAVYEEHRCPYCLQDVSRNDSRGTVECPICHTLHHKDCWDITGTCQVPHLNN